MRCIINIYKFSMQKVVVKLIFTATLKNVALSELEFGFWTLYIEKNTKCKQTVNTESKV